MPNLNKKLAPEGLKQGLTTRAEISFLPKTLNEDNRSVDFILTTENPAFVWDWERFDIVKEILLSDGFVLPKTQKIPLLDSHSRSSVDNVLGSVSNIRQEPEQVVGTLTFSTDEAAERAWQKVKEGHLDSGSVGYEQVQSEWVGEKEAKEFSGKLIEGPVLVTKTWNLKEFSLVAIGADPDAKSRSEKVTNSRVEAVTDISEEKTMRKEKTENTEISQPVAQPQNPAIDITAVKAEAVKQERERLNAITDLCKKHNAEDLIEGFIESGATLDVVRGEVLEHLATKQTPVAPALPIVMGQTDGEKFRNAASDAMLIRAGVPVANPAPGANDLRGLGFKGLAKECLKRHGQDQFMTDNQALEMVMRAGTLASSDFSNIIDQTASNAVTIGFKQARQTWRLWCSKGELSNLEAAKRLNLDDAPEMTELGEAGEVQDGVIHDKGEAIQLVTYARKLKITRKVLLADRFNLFSKLFMKFGIRAGNMIDAKAYGALTANGNLADGSALFLNTTARGNNLAAAAAVVSQTSVDIGYQKMMAQTGKSGSKLGITPQFLLVGPKNRVAAHVLTTSMQDISSNSNANGGSNAFSDLVAIATPHLSQAWYMAANPVEADTVEVAFLDGKEEPTVYEVANQGDILGKTYVGYFDVDAAPLDYRGLFKNAGA